MQQQLYTLGIRAYTFFLKFAGLFHAKARRWTRGRRNWRKALQEAVAGPDKWIWFHCASLGEFEQGLPLMEAIKEKHPQDKLLVTFFSPSGYEIRKNHPIADFVCYLPPDYPSEVRDFFEILQPKMGFFVKYEIWINLIAEAKARQIPLYLVSARMRSESRFLLGPMAPLYRKAFSSFAHIFTQDELTAAVLRRFTEKDHISVCGDTRFDRVAHLPVTFAEIPGIREFIRDDFCFIAGSTWSEDESMVLRSMDFFSESPVKLIIAPHEIREGKIQEMVEEYPEMIRYSKIDGLNPAHRTLWIDNVGMLSRLYAYADVVYIGGGFDAGIHNTQEPAIYGNPVAFGPKYGGFTEAVDMVKLGCAQRIQSPRELAGFIRQYQENRSLLQERREAVKQYMLTQTGATACIMKKLEELTPD